MSVEVFEAMMPDIHEHNAGVVLQLLSGSRHIGKDLL